MKEDKKKLENDDDESCSGSDPLYAAACPLCQEEGDNTKYVGFDLYDHLNGNKHSKSNLAGFLSQEACYHRFWVE